MIAISTAHVQLTRRFVQNVGLKSLTRLAEVVKSTPEQLEAYGDTGALDPEKVVNLWGCLFGGKSFLEANQLMDSLQFDPLVEHQPTPS